MQRRGEESHQPTDNDQRKPDLRRASPNKSHDPREGAEQRRTESYDHQRGSRPEAINEKPSRNHAEGINQQERGIDRTHLLGGDGKLFHDPFIPGHGHADTVQVADETKRHE